MVIVSVNKEKLLNLIFKSKNPGKQVWLINTDPLKEVYKRKIFLRKQKNKLQEKSNKLKEKPN